MKPEAITFDAAQTLVRVNWNPGQFALDCAKRAGLELDEPHARSVYERMLGTRWREYQEINCTRDSAACDAFWEELTSDWLGQLGHEPSQGRAMTQEGREVMYDKQSPIFQLYPDVLPVLSSLREEGIKLAVISNWDFSLHRVLRLHDAYDIFEVVIASLEEGVEKPDPRLFHLTLEKLGVDAANAVHVGDCPTDDIQGARNAGMRAVLIDRELEHPAPGVITSLNELREAIGWTA